MKQVQLDSLREKRTLKRVGSARHQHEDVKERKGNGYAARADACNARRIRKRPDKVNYEREKAQDE